MPAPPFDWNNFLTFAEKLVSTIKQEAAFRIATSRAYYAAYWKARRLLEGEGLVFPSKKSHEFCWSSFSAVYTEEGMQIGKLGFALRDRRVHADYFDVPPLGERSANSDVLDAADLIEALDHLTEPEKQTAVQRARQILPNFL